MKKLLFLSALILTFVSCSDDDSTTTPEPDQSDATVQLRTDGTFGKVLTDTEGNTLYFFSLDSKGDSNCIDGCLGAWPEFYVETIVAGDGLDAADFGQITRADGKKQTTYKGWPLYYFANDNAPGDINGDGNNTVWYVAKPDYSLMLVRAQLVGRDIDGNETNLTGTYEEGEEQTFYITDDRGYTLYSFTPDKEDTNTFTNEDFSNNGVWPIFDVNIDQLPSILNAADFGTIDVFGRKQLTFRGWPVYKFGQDVARGDNYGVGFPQAGVWPIINQDTEDAPEAINPGATYDVTNSGATAYVFDGNGLNGESNPDFTFKRGNTYTFNVNTPGHPFLIKSVQGTGTDNTYNNGVTNNGASSGTITFTVPSEAPDTLFYNCEFHGSMTGVITITD